MTSSVIEKLIPYLRNGDRIPHRIVLDALNQASDSRRGDMERRVAREISTEAGDYLPRFHLLDFISAKLSDEDCLRAVTERKVIIARMEDLLPATFGLLGEMEARTVSSIVEQVFDCAIGYQYIERAAYSSQQRKVVLKDVYALVDLLNQIEPLLERSGWHVKGEYEDHKRAIARIFSRDTSDLASFGELRKEMKSLRLAAEVALFRDSIGDEPFFVGDNKARTHIVEFAYNLSLRFGKPSFVTTPGSDFSNLCSLLFELATGTQDESLAGAINRFARSELKARIDREEMQFRDEESDEGVARREADNFADVKGRLLSLDASKELWLRILSSRSWDTFSEEQMSLRLADIRNEREIAEKTQGPHLVWASQISPAVHEQYRQEIENHEQTTLRLAIKLGLLTRAQRSQHPFGESQGSGSTQP
ncbi:hypothetical protein HFO98_34310 [Rhizobium leguminosarum]|uniref:hypothetical protein n=1 Tax=Rhizobium leguminosarum TaxID=384 RepID=UPI001C984182|nr:hypothetical protein [Rhizobium leguminosarum]MBY5413397.1 hypothetical protein [Rhizobium leguminosarum]